MAFFGVTIEKIGEIQKHPNADRLDLAKLEGMDFQFIVGKGTYNPGDEVIYFPVDSQIPEKYHEQLGVKGKLAGRSKDRVKTIRLRGELSQGLVAPLESINGINPNMTSTELTEFLGVKKWEPPTITSRAGKLMALPDGMWKYDIEGADRFKSVARLLMDQKCLIMEKMEGSNFSVSYSGLHEKVFVNQRRFTIIPIEEEEHAWWSVARKSGLIEAVENLKDQSGAGTVAIYGEFCGPGIQKNIYRLNEPKVFLFDIMIDGNFIDVDKFMEIANPLQNEYCEIAPVLGMNVSLREWLDNKSIKEASTDESKIYQTLREGIVIKPMFEQRCEEIGRLILKQRSPEYLEKTGL